jgi:Domain of unknown function (DUF4331)
MADHLDAPGLKSPNMDARVDITDHYAFQKPDDPNKTVLILNVNPLAPTLADRFDPDAIYELKVDTNADAVAEISFKFTFSTVGYPGQTATVRRATGADASGMSLAGDTIIDNAPVSYGTDTKVTTSGDFNFFAGMRSDPFFFDLLGFLNGFKFTGSDFFIDKNVFSMALEVPNSALGTNPKVGIWARVLVPKDNIVGLYSQVDRMGRPAINTVFNHGQDKVTFNQIEPTQDRAMFEASFVSTLESFKYSAAQATTIAEILLPDLLTYDYTSSAGFLNGRKLTDDVIDIELNLVTNGAITTDMVGPHTDLLTTFPYLGVAHGIPLAAVAAPAGHYSKLRHRGE